ncbi:MAG: 4-alpha-glucanotransferase, partial [Candidatus Omnitrophica bacterium]|nr:4-alpha-glucanotransferase [Candidatus Omnitrophota bacterium]
MSEGNYSKILFSTRSKEKWQRIGPHRRAGVLLPLFSVYSKKSLGIGEFEDLKPAADWCVKAGFSIIQLLPINEVGPVFCPYDSVSSFALEPMYISLRLLPHTDKKEIKEKIDILKKRFPCGGPHVDYAIKWEKLSVLWDIYSKEKIDSLKDFKAFRRENEYWIEDFALFKILKENNGGSAWYDWPDPLKHRDPAALKSFADAHAKEIVFHIWIQWRLYQQLKAARVYAAGKGLLLKGDLPILVSRDSADVWAHPEFFKLDFASGAPPDMYCAKGQRWGMPTYNWEAIEKLGFRYLKEKLKYAENFYDLLRIDHVVGLFRIWSIPYSEPMENQGLHGFFDPPDESKWGNHGQKILSVMLENTSMVLCAEDLGVIPKVCTDTLAEFGIPGNNVQRWVKDWDNKHDFLSPEEYRFLSVAMLSTHDTTNWAAWWEYEAGTVDEQLFIRKCADRGIDYSRVRGMLFHPELSRYGRLRWLDGIGSVDVLVKILG